MLIIVAVPLCQAVEGTPDRIGIFWSVEDLTLEIRSQQFRFIVLLRMKRKAVQLQFNKNMSNLRGATDETKSDSPYDYDLAVIGGGSGGMAAAKEAARNGARVRFSK